MKIRIKRSALEHALAIASACLPTKALRPVLMNVKLSVQGTDVEIQATDLEMSVRHRIDEAEVLEPGEVLLPGRSLMEIVREGRQETALDFEVKGSACAIRGDKSFFEISCEDVADFPELPQRKEGGMKLPPKDVREMIHQTVFAVSPDNPRAALTGVLLRLETGSVEMVATDGRRLALTKRAIDGGPAEPQETILPAKTLREVERSIADDEQAVTLITDEGQSQAVFQTERTMIASATIDAQYPAYKEVLPKGLDKKAVLKCAAFESAIRQASVMAGDDTRAVDLDFEASDLIVRSRSAERGQAEVRLDGVTLDGGPMKVSFNPDYLLDVLKVIDEDEVTIQFKDNASAAQMTTGRAFLYVIMPIKPAPAPRVEDEDEE